MSPRRASRFLVLVLLALVLATSASVVQAGSGGGIRRAAQPVKGRYIVTLSGGVPGDAGAAARGLARRYEARVERVYRTALRGFSARMTERRALALSRDSRVASVEEDGIVTASATQSSPPWGLDRIDQRDRPLDASYTYASTGAGVTAYVIDTGIRTSHAQFGGRARSGYDFVDGDANTSDCNGHGTHVAGTIGGSTYGVAKAVSLVGVRVLNCSGSGSWSGVIAGIDWVTANRSGPSVANMSLGGGASSSVDAAVANSVAAGVTYAIAAGNGNRAGVAQDACNYSPARVSTALTVSATDSSDRKASWANYGSCVDIFAPGVSVKSAWYTSDTATNTISGTSMATPHVAGAVALYLQGSPSASPAQVADALTATASPGKVSSAGSGSPNLLLYVGPGATVEPDPSPSPSPSPEPSLSPSPEPDPDAIALTASGYKVKGWQYADLSWTGANGASVDVFRDSTKLTTTTASAYTDELHAKGGGSHAYRVCYAGTSTCSNTATASF